MWHKVVNGIGFLLIALVFVGLCLTAYVALRSGHMFMGFNYKGQPLEALGVLLALVLIAVVAAIRGVRRVYLAFKAWRRRAVASRQ
ncbi:MAG: hypothetical protein ACHP84_05190 [Caulobacterales bacterium]